MKRFLLMVVALLLAVAPLTSCSKENVTKHNKSAKYDSIANIKANTPATCKKEMGNIKFDGSVIIPDAAECYNISFKHSAVYSEKRGELKELFIDNYSSDFESHNSEKDEMMYLSDSQCLVANPKGHFYYQKIYQEELLNNSFPYVERARFYRGEAPSQTEYLMLDGTTSSMAAAKAQLQEFLDGTMKKYEPDYDFAVRTAFTRRMPDGEHYIFDFVVNRTFEGVAVDAKAYFANDIKTVGNTTRFGIPVNFYIPSANGFKNWYIVLSERSYTVTEKTKLPDKFITFESALELLRREITALGDITLDSAEFCYIMSFDGENRDKASEFYAKPMWTFTSPVSDEELSLEIQKGCREVQRLYAVDAVTGDVFIYYDLLY